METVKVTKNGAALSMTLPASLMRTLGWVRGDQLMVYAKGGDLVVRNDSERAARFTRQFRARKENFIAAEAR
jgi:antitoxin component of MazEF toxin-antitoxin module